MVLRFLLEKEFKQFLRNPFLKRIALIFPIMIILIFPLVATFEVHHIKIVAINYDNSSSANRFLEKIQNSKYFDLTGLCHSYAQGLEKIEEGKADIIVTIPHNFEKDLVNNEVPSLQVNANSVNGIKGNIGISYMNSLIREFIMTELNIDRSKLPEFETSYMYNPTLDYKKFMIPALITMIIIVFCGFLPALNIVTEKEKGTIEQINVSPVSKSIFILAKLIPYWTMGLIMISVSLLFAWLVYGFTPVGNIFCIYLAAMLFILIMSGIGLIISNYSETMQQAMFVMFFCIMLFTLMCGLFTPVQSMPEWAQKIAFFIPPRYFVNIMRAVFLKGTGIIDNSHNYLMLLIIATTINIWAVISYKKRA